MVGGRPATYSFSEHWLLVLDAHVVQLTGDAVNSPIVFSKTEASVMSAIAYRF